MSQKFTAEEVRKEADFLSTYSRKTSRMLAAYADTLSQPADSGRVDANCMDVLRRLRDMLPTVGICGWPAGVSALDEAISTLAAQGQGDGKVAAWVEPDVIEAMQPDDDWDGADGVECMLLKERGEKHTVALFTHSAPPASPAGVPDEATDEFVPRWWDESHGDAYKEGWNDCRKAMLAAAPSAPEGDGGAE